VASTLRLTRFSWDSLDSGNYKISGVVDKLGVVGVKRVRLIERRTNRLVREVWSNAFGEYLFDYIVYQYQGYYVIAMDHGASLENAVIADFVTPVLRS
jgi:hypothetical protein